jgi:phosphocarrier protein HPr
MPVLIKKEYDMVKREIEIGKEQGLKSKTAAIFVQKASLYKSSILIEKGERKANGKSMLGLLSLVIEKGEKITLTIDGFDEDRAIKELEEFLKS